MTPLLSVVISNYNDERFLETALKAIREQSFPGMEIIFIDDASTDKSLDVAEKILAKSQNFRILKNKLNQGVIKNYNQILNQISSQFVYFASSNDMVDGKFLKHFCQQLQKFPEAGLVSGLVWTMNEQNKKIKPLKCHIPSSKTEFIPADVVAEIIEKKGNWIIGCSTVYRRDKLQQYGGFEPNLLGATDSCVATLIAMNHGVVFIPDVVAHWRISEIGFALSSVGDWSSLKSMIKTGEVYFSKNNIRQSYINQWRKELLFWHYQSKLQSTEYKSTLEYIIAFERLPKWLELLFLPPLPKTVLRYLGLLIIAPKKIIKRFEIEIDWLFFRLWRNKK